MGLTSYFETASATWVHGLPQMKTPVDHAVGLAVEGGLYVMGGRNGTIDSTVDSVGLFVFSKDVWTIKPSMQKARAGHGGALINNTILVLGGESLLEEKSKFQVVSDIEGCRRMPLKCGLKDKMVPPLHGMSVVAVGGTIYIAGGANETTFGPVATHMSYSFT